MPRCCVWKTPCVYLSILAGFAHVSVWEYCMSTMWAEDWCRGSFVSAKTGMDNMRAPKEAASLSWSNSRVIALLSRIEAAMLGLNSTAAGL